MMLPVFPLIRADPEPLELIPEFALPVFVYPLVLSRLMLPVVAPKAISRDSLTTSEAAPSVLLVSS